MVLMVIFFIGTKIERSKKALRNMGPAVLNGGFSTFLSFVLLANSGSHVFETFFKVSPLKLDNTHWVKIFFAIFEVSNNFGIIEKMML